MKKKALYFGLFFILFLFVSISFAPFTGWKTHNPLPLHSTPAEAQEPPKEPMLRIETGMHTAVIEKIAVDPKERYLVTGSDDKTARVWDLQTGRLLRTLRPPIGMGYEGRVCAVAVSPDGKTIACGGWTGYEWDQKHSIYFFDRETGSLIRRKGELPNVIYYLAYSRDGKFLVATLGENNGIRVFETEGYDVKFSDSKYGDSSNWADFDSTGKLVVTSDDGYVRLYGRDFVRKAEKKLQGGSRPFGVRFSPDGTKIAVGFADSLKVEVLSADDLSHLFYPDTSLIDNGNLFAVAWSSDGKDLYGGGQYYGSGNCPIVKWSEGGRGKPKFLKGADATIRQILPLLKGGVVFGAGDPAFGRINDQDKRVLFQGPSNADYRAAYEGFRISPDGKTVRFGYELYGKIPARFSLEKRIIELIEPAGGTVESLNLAPPITSVEGIQIEDWRDSFTPKLNGKPLPLRKNEMCFSLAIAPNKEFFVLGTGWYLRLFDAKGNEKWNIPVPIAWGVNISGDGKKVVAALHDGTIRWYQVSDGKELLALFPHSDRKRWIAWTPSGYYDASVGAEDLIGWHINNGREKAADFFPASLLRQKFYRPGVVAKVLGTLDEQRALQLADKETGRKTQEVLIAKSLPPVVTILSPQEGAEIQTKEVTVSIRVRSLSGDPVTRIEARVNGNPGKVEKDLNLAGREITRTVRVSLLKEDNRIAIIAGNKNGESEPAFVQVKWTGSIEEGLDKRPTLYVLAIGVSNYREEKLREGAKWAAKDAEDFVKAITSQKGGIYKDVQKMVLVNEKAAEPKDILTGFNWIEREPSSYDVSMIFMAGHGKTDLNGRYFFFPSDVDTKNLRGTALSHTEIIDTIKAMAGKVFLFIDTCYSGLIIESTRGETDIEGIVNEIISTQKEGVVFASSAGNQKSLQYKENGAFTKALTDGLKGAAVEPGTSKITIGSLGRYIAIKVKEYTEGQQTPPIPAPFRGGLGESYTLAVKK